MGCFRATRYAPLLLVVTLAACKEGQSGVEVKDLSFSGNTAVSDAQLKSVLATAESAKLPWGAKQYFSREEFEADLKRVVAFYRDRGYPDARVQSFDARLSDDQKSVRLAIAIDEGEPIRVERVVLTGLDPIPEEHRHDLETRLPLKAGAPLDRSLLQASREAARRRAQGPWLPESRRQRRRVAGFIRAATDHHLYRSARPSGVCRPNRNLRDPERQRAHRAPSAHVPARTAVRAEQAA